MARRRNLVQGASDGVMKMKMICRILVRHRRIQARTENVDDTEIVKQGTTREMACICLNRYAVIS